VLWTGKFVYNLPILTISFRTKVNELVGIPKLEQLIQEEAAKIERIDKSFKKPPHLQRVSEQKKKSSKPYLDDVKKKSDNQLGVE